MNNGESREPPAVAGEEAELRGAELGSQQFSAVDHVAQARKRNPDRELRLDGEADTLYSDGLDLDGDGENLYGTDGARPKGIRG
jgi:hypothetical protein